MGRTESLRRRIEDIAAEADAEAIGVAVFDYGTGSRWDHAGERWFHAASTIKIPVLLGVFDAIRRGEIEPRSRVHVRNRFLSVAGGAPYRIDASRDADAEVHASVGRTMQVAELARRMIVSSSNLATNVLVDLVGTEAIRETLRRLGLEGIDFRRGVEDLEASEAGIDNRVTASGLLGALRALEDGERFSRDLADEMLDILHDQEFRAGIPAGLPDEARVANKTGEISTVAHDAGIVYLPGRDPYVVVILTEWHPEKGGRKDTIARLSRAVYEDVAGRGEES